MPRRWRTVPFITALALFFVTLPTAQGGSTRRSTCSRSVLCDGLVGIYLFEEASDATRLNQYGLLDLFEPDGIQVGNAASLGPNLGTNAVTFNGTTDYLSTSVDLGILGSGNWTVAFWIYPTVGTSTQVLLSENEVDSLGTVIDLSYSGTGVRPRATGYNGLTSAPISATWGTDLALGAWHEVVVTMRSSSVAAGEMTIQVDNGARVATSIPIGVFINASGRPLYVGKQNTSSPLYYAGRLDHLAFVSGVWTTAIASYYWNLGNGQAYPFVTH